MEVNVSVFLLLLISTVSVFSQTVDPIVGTWDHTKGGIIIEYKQASDGAIEGFVVDARTHEYYGYYIGELIVKLRNTGQSNYEGIFKARDSAGNITWVTASRAVLDHNTLRTYPEGSTRVRSTYKRMGAVESGSSTKASGCPNVLGIGKLVAMLEMGAIGGYDNTWIVGTIDYAIEHINSLGCLSNTYLKGLRPRILSTTDNKQFYNEIHSYSLSLDSEVMKCF